MLIGYHNHFANPAGSWQSIPVPATSLNATNLQRLLSPHIDEPGVATLNGSLFAMKRRFSSVAVPIQIIAILGHNLAPGATLGLTMFNGGAAVSGFGTLVTPAPLTGFQNDYILILDEPLMCTDIQFIADDWTGPPAVGTFFVSPIYRPPEGAKNDWSTYVKDLTQSRLTPGGQAYDSARQIVRVIESPGIDLLTLEQAYGSASYTLPDLQQVAHIIGTTGRVMAVMREFDDAGVFSPHMVRRTSLYGQCTSGIRIVHQTESNYSTERIVFEQRF